MSWRKHGAAFSPALHNVSEERGDIVKLSCLQHSRKYHQHVGQKDQNSFIITPPVRDCSIVIKFQQRAEKSRSDLRSRSDSEEVIVEMRCRCRDHYFPALHPPFLSFSLCFGLRIMFLSYSLLSTPDNSYYSIDLKGFDMHMLIHRGTFFVRKI